MDMTDFRKQKNAEFLAEYELSNDELERLIEGKFKRAKAFYEALHKREDQVVEFDR